MSSVFQTVQQRKQQCLPLSQSQTPKQGPGIRRRLSSLSLNLKIQAPSSESVSYAGNSIRKWWGWILSRKPTFASDLEMNEEETAALGTHNRGSWRHLFYKITTQLRHKLLGGADNVPLPKTFRYDSFNNRSRSASYIH